MSLNEEKIDRCRGKLLKYYFDESIIEEVTSATDYHDTIHRSLNFLKFGVWQYVPKKWFTDPSIYPDMVFSDYGRGIALGEEKHIVETILANGNTKRLTLDMVNYESIMEALRDLASEIQRPFPTLHFILFAPIDYMVAMYTDWMRDSQIPVRLVGRDELLAGRFRMRILWSSKYIDYNEFIILEQALCRWIAKPNVNNRLEVEIRESDKRARAQLRSILPFLIRNIHSHSALSF